MAQAVAFLRSVGITVREEQPAPAGCFFPGVWYDGDALCYDPRVAHVGDLVHDAGHMAVLPSRLRRLLTVGCFLEGIAMKAEKARLEEEAFYSMAMLPKESWSHDVMAILHSEEAEATAWSYAACVAAGVDARRVLDEVPFYTASEGLTPDGGRRMREALDERKHPGIGGLHEAGLCTKEEFPRMRRWLQL